MKQKLFTRQYSQSDYCLEIPNLITIDIYKHSLLNLTVHKQCLLITVIFICTVQCIEVISHLISHCTSAAVQTFLDKMKFLIIYLFSHIRFTKQFGIRTTSLINGQGHLLILLNFWHLVSFLPITNILFSIKDQCILFNFDL